MEKSKFVVWNYKYNKFLPCDIISKIDDTFVRVVEHSEKDGDIYTTVYWTNIKNNI